MTLLGGILKVADTTPLAGIPVRELSDAVNALNERYVTERNTWDNFLVERETDEHQVKHLLTGIDEGQELGEDGAPIETHVGGKVDVGFPWKRWGWAVGWTYEAFQRMTVADMERNIAARQGGNAKRHLREQFRALMSNANYDYLDEDFGTITVRRLANTDGTLFPPVSTSDSEADDTHYLVSGYANNAMSATQNPFVTLKNEIVEHFGSNQRVVAIINPAQRAEVVTDIPNFTDAPTIGIRTGADTAVAEPLGVSVPGTFLGVDNDSGVWVYVNEEGRVPADYILSSIVGVAPPLWRRVPGTQSLRGFKLESEHEHDPMFKRIYRDRFGYGVANRLSTAIMQLKASGSYDIPSAYA